MFLKCNNLHAVVENNFTLHVVLFVLQGMNIQSAYNGVHGISCIKDLVSYFLGDCSGDGDGLCFVVQHLKFSINGLVKHFQNYFTHPSFLHSVHEIHCVHAHYVISLCETL